MPVPGRSQPCPCGSGRKTKRCCGQARGPSEDWKPSSSRSVVNRTPGGLQIAA